MANPPLGPSRKARQDKRPSLELSRHMATQLLDSMARGGCWINFLERLGCRLSNEPILVVQRLYQRRDCCLGMLAITTQRGCCQEASRHFRVLEHSYRSLD